jgi:hypothetical protein
MTSSTVTVRSVRSAGAGPLPVPAAVLSCRRRPHASGTFRHRVATVDGLPAAGLLIGFPVLGELHAQRTEALHGRLATMPAPLPDGLAATACWTGVVERADGSHVYAALAPDPYAEGYVPLHEVIRDGLLDVEPARARFELAYSLAAAADDIARLGAVHGGLDASTLLVRVSDRSVRITELESATLALDSGHLPLAAGAATGYLPPEQYDGLGEHPETASRAGDRWALAVALHEVLTGYRPYHFLPDLSPGVVAAYLAGGRWPAHHLDGAAAFATRYAALAELLPDEIRAAFSTTFQDGWADPSVRPSAADWQAMTGRWIGDPVVDELRVDRGFVVRGDPAAGSVTVSWRTRFAHRVVIDGRYVGRSSGSLAVPRSRPGPISVHAIGPCGATVRHSPRIEVLRVPQLRLAEIRFPAGLYPGAGRPGDGAVRRVRPPSAHPPPATPLPGRPSIPAIGSGRLPPAAPSPSNLWSPPTFYRVAETFRRLRARGSR